MLLSPFRSHALWGHLAPHDLSLKCHVVGMWRTCPQKNKNKNKNKQKKYIFIYRPNLSWGWMYNGRVPSAPSALSPSPISLRSRLLRSRSSLSRRAVSLARQAASRASLSFLCCRRRSRSRKSRWSWRSVGHSHRRWPGCLQCQQRSQSLPGCL